MRKGESGRLEALEALLAEKRKHEGYLAKLEERRAGTPEHVFARLRDEYLTKFTDAQVRAATEAEALASELEEDEESVREAEAKLSSLEEEKVEAELRAAVGEIEPKEWQKKLTAFTAAITMAEKERDARRTSFERTRALLAEARGGAAPSSPSTTTGEGPSAPTPGKVRPTATMASGPNFDELAFLNSVVGRSSPAGTAATKPEGKGDSKDRASKPTPGEATAAQPSLPLSTAPIKESSSAPKPEARSEPKPEPKVEAPSEEPAEAKAESPAAAEAKPAEPAKAEAAKADEKPAPRASKSTIPLQPAPLPEDEEEDGPPSVLGRPTPRTSQAIKTLKCAECGSMNYPTEWYCERCGGELAAL